MVSIQKSDQSPQNFASPSPSGKQHQIVIVGGGAAGITVASHLVDLDRGLDIAIIEPSDQHHYQPGWTLVGGGIAPIEKFTRSQREVMPPGTTWIQARVTTLDPDRNTVITDCAGAIEYQYLVVCPGIQIDWHLVEGLKEALGHGGVTSNYAKAFAPYTWETIQNFKGGNALFTYPATPIKCGGAPQKVMYMADDTFKAKSGVGVNTSVLFCTAGKGLFSVPEYAASLEQVVARRGIVPKFQHNLKAIKASTQEAIFEVTTEAGVEQISLHYDMIHVAPPMSAPDFIKNSPLASNTPGGWVAVDPATLQHLRYANVFSLGDASSLPTSKTAAAVRKSAPIVSRNLYALIRGQSLQAQYDGYTCCPLITGYNSAIMAEFAYGGKLAPSFPLDPTQERYAMYLAKVHVLPWIYWHRMLKGKAFEADIFKPLHRLLQS
jgi:sulfide:quinone oxidoreductase